MILRMKWTNERNRHESVYRGEYRDCFLDEIKAYQYALSLANKDKICTIRIIEKDFSSK